MEGQVKRLALLAIVMLVTLAAPAAAQEGRRISVGELLQEAATVTGQVVVVGELIGDYGFRSDGSMWTQLNGDTYAYDPTLDGGPLTGGNVGVAVRIPTAMAELLDKPGGYRVRGPVVRVVGQWEYHDPNRGGESYINVTAIEILEPGRGLIEHPNYLVMAIGVVLIAVAALLRRGAIRARH
jgi:hypothetical protein